MKAPEKRTKYLYAKGLNAISGFDKELLLFLPEYDLVRLNNSLN